MEMKMETEKNEQSFLSVFNDSAMYMTFHQYCQQNNTGYSYHLYNKKGPVLHQPLR